VEILCYDRLLRRTALIKKPISGPSDAAVRIRCELTKINQRNRHETWEQKSIFGVALARVS
jgi:hypothetical protein